MSKTPSPSHGPEHHRRRLLEIRINYWPQPAGQAAISRKWLRWIGNDLVAQLNVERWTGNPPFRRPHANATARKSKGAKATETATPYCWINAFEYGTCEIGGEEVPCRIEHWLCDDGTYYDKEVPLAAALKAMRLSAAAGDGADAG
jgi:hypothetical protein